MAIDKAALQALGMTEEEVLEMLIGSKTQAAAPVRQLGRRIQPAAGVKSTTVALEADETVATQAPKGVKPTLVVPKSAEVVQYNDGKTERSVVVRKIGKTGVNDRGPWAADYIEFAGFKGLNGDFKLTMNQARFLADEAVQLALASIMSKIPR